MDQIYYGVVRKGTEYIHHELRTKDDIAAFLRKHDNFAYILPYKMKNKDISNANNT